MSQTTSFFSLVLALLSIVGVVSQGCQVKKEVTTTQAVATYAIVIHGGAGYMSREHMSEERILQYTMALDSALDTGERILIQGGSSLDAVENTINYMEDNPLFNAGKGAVFTHEGHNSMDASIMDGRDRNAGAVGGVSIVKNPISAARAVMEKSVHVMLSGNGADRFATEVALEIVEPSYFYTEKSWNRLQSAIKSEEEKQKDKHGTVGCVALDQHGNIAAGTSTGGMTNKKYGRIGDSPIIGAGTYADNKTCGVSATGHGEFFIRNTVARDIAAMMEYKGSTLQESSEYIINKVLVEASGDGGIVAIDKWGNIAMPFNTSGMFRGYRRTNEKMTKIFKD